MKFKTIALATAFALTSTFALAQTSGGSAGGSSTAGGPAAAGTSTGGSMDGSTTGPTGRPSGDAAMQKNMGTTGTSKQGPGASEQGADTAASVGAKGDSTEPGKVKDGKTR
jgi:hypothetical protein